VRWPESLSALVLAAGLGTRLDPLTRLVAKAAVPLGRRSLIEHVLSWLAMSGVGDVVINLHHRPDTITTIVGDGVHLGVRVRYSWEQPILGSGGGPRRALPLLSGDPFLIVNGDTLTELDLQAMMRRHDAMGGDVTMAVVPNPAPSQYNGIRSGPDGEIQEFVPRGRADGTWHFIGVQIARRSIFQTLSDGVPAETVAGFYRDLVRAQPGRLRVWPAPTPFLDVGTPADYLGACLAMTAREQGSDVEESRSTGGATVDLARRTVVWTGATLSPSARLENAIVAGAVHVPAGFTASNAIIVPQTVMRGDDAARVESNLAIFPLR
jgi:mannose-1-phosphate guanylyltransferase/mannose-1-phosphate guanylyltransferase/phosphomannomutase